MKQDGAIQYKRELKGVSGLELAHLIVALECLTDELRDKFKAGKKID